MLVNMGGPESPEELKTFLSRMFKDPAILPYRKPVRHLLSFIISRSRYKNPGKKYELIGGTPLVQSTIKTSRALQAVLGTSFAVNMHFPIPHLTSATLYMILKRGSARYWRFRFILSQVYDHFKCKSRY